MSASETGASPAYASAAHAARLIGKSERIVQLWMAEAGHAGERVSGAGYPVQLLCAVVNDHKWPHKFRVTPEHFNSDTGPTEDSSEGFGTENTAALAVFGQLDALQRSILATGERQTAMAAELAELRAQVAQLLEDNRRQRERDERAAERAQDGLVRHDAALERIERAVRRKSWWERFFGK